MTDDSYFSFTGYTADFASGIVRFEYELGHKGSVHRFTDSLSYEPNETTLNMAVPSPELSRVLQSLHLFLGISYWKTYCPSDIRTPRYTLSRFEAQFWNTVYTKGLGEFFYKNSIDYRGLIQFPVSGAGEQISPVVHRADRSLVLIGGGKDSVVTGEMLKKSHKEFSLLAVNATNTHKKTAEIMGKNLISVTRTIDPSLFVLNAMPDVYNGHVPISSIFAAIGEFAAFIFDYSYVIASNEASANIGNVSYLGAEINHQWSKSIEFEDAFRQYSREHVLQGIEYFSLLRPFSEFAIARKFSQYSTYFPVFISCNRAYRISPGARPGGWCGHCPKCAYVFIALAGFLPKDTLLSIFGKNLLDDQTLIPLYEQLCGIRGIKPFECVGTPHEVRAAFRLVRSKSLYESDCVMRAIFPAISNISEQGTDESLFTPSEAHNIPDTFKGVIQST